MYRVVIVENVHLHGQNRKKSKKFRVFGIFKCDPGGCCFDLHKNRTTRPIFYFFNRREILSSLIYYRPIIYKIWTVTSYKRKAGKSPKISKFFGH